MKARKWMAVLALGMFFSGAVVDDAMARAGRSARSGIHRSTGWRGTRTPESGQMQGINQSRRSPNQTAANQAQRPSWFQRNPFMAGIMGALAGSAIFAALSSAFGGFGGFGGGGFMMILLLLGAAMLAMRFFRSRQQPGYAAAGRDFQESRSWTPQDLASRFGSQGQGSVADFGTYRQSREQGLAAIALETPTFTTAKAEDELSSLFFRVQEAWTADDRPTLRSLLAPELYEEFQDDLTAMAAQHERNVLKNVLVRSFEITEAWQDADEEFITAKIQARLLDYVERNGQVVEGSATEPTEFREAWTFARPRQGQEWRLSAINQF